jgi:hypothetical protein
MYTIASLKAQHKTLAAAKAATGVKAASWAVLVEKLNLQPVIEPLGYQSDYFKSAEAELIYSIVKLDGQDRTKALNITGNHYRDAKKAKSWRNEIAAKIHPDKCAHPAAQTAISEITELYKLMVA